MIFVLHEFQRRHLDVRGAIAPGALELQHDITRPIVLEPFVGDRGAGDVAAQPFEFLALMRALDLDAGESLLVLETSAPE